MKQVDYEEISKVYDDVREGDVVLTNQFVKELPSDGSVTILDLGCGTGRYTDLFQKITQDRGYELESDQSVATSYELQSTMLSG